MERIGMSSLSIHIRMEDAHDPEELAAIREVNEAAFGGSDEADLVDNIRVGEHQLLSLVAEVERRVVGHLLFSRMWVESLSDTTEAVALAPVAVLPDHQRKGIGSSLIQEGLQLLRRKGERIVIVVGHSDYYPRFGFSSQLVEHIESPFPRDVFMAMELEPGALAGVKGTVKYP